MTHLPTWTLCAALVPFVAAFAQHRRGSVPRWAGYAAVAAPAALVAWSLVLFPGEFVLLFGLMAILFSTAGAFVALGALLESIPYALRRMRSRWDRRARAATRRRTPARVAPRWQ